MIHVPALQHRLRDKENKMFQVHGCVYVNVCAYSKVYCIWWGFEVLLLFLFLLLARYYSVPGMVWESSRKGSVCRF